MRIATYVESTPHGIFGVEVRYKATGGEDTLGKQPTGVKRNRSTNTTPVCRQKAPAGSEEKDGVVEGALVAVSHDLGRQENDTIVQEAERRPDDAGYHGPPSQLRYAPEVKHATGPLVFGFLKRTDANIHTGTETKKRARGTQNNNSQVVDRFVEQSSEDSNQQKMSGARGQTR